MVRIKRVQPDLVTIARCYIATIHVVVRVVSFRIGRVLINSFYMQRRAPIPSQRSPSYRAPTRQSAIAAILPVLRAIIKSHYGKRTPFIRHGFTAGPIKILRPDDGVKREIITRFYGDLYLSLSVVAEPNNSQLLFIVTTIIIVFDTIRHFRNINLKK